MIHNPKGEAICVPGGPFDYPEMGKNFGKNCKLQDASGWFHLRSCAINFGGTLVLDKPN